MADLNVKDNDGRTPIFYCRDGACNTLIDSGADVNIVDSYGMSFLEYYISTEKEFYKFFDFTKSLPLNNSNINRVFEIALRKECPSKLLFQYLIKLGADINMIYSDGLTSLQLACRVKIDWLIKHIIKNCIHYVISDEKGNTLLHEYIGFTPNINIIADLIGYGVNINTRNSEGLTPFQKMVGSIINYSDIQEIDDLLSLGADPNVKSLEGNTCLHDILIMDLSDTNVIDTYIKLIYKYGFTLDVGGKYGYTPLQIALMMRAYCLREINSFIYLEKMIDKELFSHYYKEILKLNAIIKTLVQHGAKLLINNNISISVSDFTESISLACYAISIAPACYVFEFNHYDIWIPFLLGNQPSVSLIAKPSNLNTINYSIEIFKSEEEKKELKCQNSHNRNYCTTSTRISTLAELEAAEFDALYDKVLAEPVDATYLNDLFTGLEALDSLTPEDLDPDLEDLCKKAKNSNKNRETTEKK